MSKATNLTSALRFSKIETDGMFFLKGYIMHHTNETTMKIIFTFIFLMSCSIASMAQASQTGTQGSMGGQGGIAPSVTSNGDENLQYQHRPDSTHSDKDTSYMKQQWNNGASQNQGKSKNKSTKKKK